MDTIRGISLFGILLMNIVGFGLYKAYFDPTNNGGATGLNLTVWWMNTLFFEGTMRGMFSMLFGAGILLFTSRKSESMEGTAVTDLFFRRLLWMLLFGVIHCYLLLWDGEILYPYAIVGMFAFSFRHLNPKNLLIGAAIILIIATAFTVKDYFKYSDAFAKATVAETKKMNGQTLSQEDSTSIEKWNGIVKEEKETPEQLKQEMSARSKGYWSIVMHKLPVNQYMEMAVLYQFLGHFGYDAVGHGFFQMGHPEGR